MEEQPAVDRHMEKVDVPHVSQEGYTRAETQAEIARLGFGKALDLDNAYFPILRDKCITEGHEKLALIVPSKEADSVEYVFILSHVIQDGEDTFFENDKAE